MGFANMNNNYDGIYAYLLFTHYTCFDAYHAVMPHFNLALMVKMGIGSHQKWFGFMILRFPIKPRYIYIGSHFSNYTEMVKHGTKKHMTITHF